MSEESKTDVKVGFCSFCGQGQQFPDVTVECTQEELNELATQKCSCSEAKSYVRQIERRKRIDRYIKSNFDEEAQEAVKGIVHEVENGNWSQVDIKNELTGWKTTFKTDKDGYLVITKKRTVSGESLRE